MRCSDPLFNAPTYMPLYCGYCCPQAKKNVVSGKVFEAHEEISKTQKTIESKEQQLQQLQAIVEHHRHQEALVRAENEQLRQQLQQLQQQQQQSGRSSDAGVSRSQLQLPIQQMLAQQQQQQQQHQAAIAALSSRGGLTGRESFSGSPMAAAGSSSPFTASGADSPRGSKIGRMRVDKTPPRDQDEFSLAVGSCSCARRLTQGAPGSCLPAWRARWSSSLLSVVRHRCCS